MRLKKNRPLLLLLHIKPSASRSNSNWAIFILLLQRVGCQSKRNSEPASTTRWECTKEHAYFRVLLLMLIQILRRGRRRFRKIPHLWWKINGTHLAFVWSVVNSPLDGRFFVWMDGVQYFDWLLHNTQLSKPVKMNEWTEVIIQNVSLTWKRTLNQYWTWSPNTLRSLSQSQLLY